MHVRTRLERDKEGGKSTVSDAQVGVCPALRGAETDVNNYIRI